MLIPKLKTRLVQDIEHILAATHSSDELRHFKHTVRQAYKRHLVSSVDFELQDKRRLVQFRKDVLQNDTKLNQYRNQWPIDAYSKIWGQSYKWRISRKGSNTRLPLYKSTYHRKKAANITRGKTGSQGRKSRTLFVGKPPLGHRLVSKTKKVIGQGQLDGDESEPTQTLSGYRNALSATSSQSLPSSHSALNSILCIQGAQQPPTTQTMVLGKHSLLKRYPSPCAFCHFLPVIPNDIKSQLLRLFSDIPHVVPHLGSIGLVHDLHLTTLLSWDREERQEFCSNLPLNLFSNLDLITITTRLVEQPESESKDFTTTSANTHGEQQQSAGEKCENVPWPNEDAKKLLMTSPDILGELKRAMGKHGTDELLTRLTELVDQHGTVFLQNYRPYERGSCGRLNDTVKMILKVEQRLRQFEDAWPVCFYLQRRASDQSKRVPQSKCSTANVPPVTVNDHKRPAVATAHEGTQIVTDPECPTHLQPDLTQVSESIINFFSKPCSRELVIPLALIGVRTNQQFSLLRSMSPEQVTSLVTRTDSQVARASLNLFQRVLLKILLRG